MHVHTHTHTHICTYTHIHTYIYARTLIHTYTYASPALFNTLQSFIHSNYVNLFSSNGHHSAYILWSITQKQLLFPYFYFNNINKLPFGYICLFLCIRASVMVASIISLTSTQETPHQEGGGI